jgi:glycosyltransferase 2 family protein
MDRIIKQLRKSWLNLLLLVLIVLALIFVVDLGNVFGAVLTIPLWALVLGLLLASIDRFLMGYKWRQLIQAAGGRLRIIEAVSIYYQTGLSSRLLPVPVSSELLRAHLVIQAGVPSALVFGSMAMEKLIAWLASSLLGLGSLLYLLAEIQQDSRALFLWSILLIFGIGSAALMAALYRPVHRMGGKLVQGWMPEKIIRLLRKFSAAVLVYRSRPTALGYNLLLALGEQLLQFTKFFVLGRALGIDLPVLTFFAIIALTIVVRRVTSYFEGWGIGEASTVVMLALLGVDRDLAVALGFLNYAVTVVAALPGAYLLYRNGAGLHNWVGRVKDQLVE